jgi:cell pole-organizing protein PopZ
LAKRLEHFMASNPQHEPTMEEILASIRKIISEDSNDAQPAEAPKPVAAAAADADVLELTQEVEEPAPPPPPAPRPAPEPIRPAPVAAAPRPENDVVFETIEEPVPTPATESHSDIFSDRTRKAVEDTFANIDSEEEEPPHHESSPMPSIDGKTVEAVFERAVRESFAPVLTQYLSANSDDIVARMKPLIREWMDEHFPALLEGAVRNEVARAVKARGRR